MMRRCGKIAESQNSLQNMIYGSLVTKGIKVKFFVAFFGSWRILVNNFKVVQE